MKKMSLIAAIAAATTVGSGAGAGELPTFELLGFPITRHQVAVTGAQNVEEQSPTPTLTLGGMPASPHQVAVLTPRSRTRAEAAAVKEAAVGLTSALVLICSAAVAADPRDCTRSNANTVMRVPAEFGNPSTCFMHAQAYLAGSAIGRQLDANDWVKVLCVRSETLDVSAEH
jgi:hypothetical protein